MSMMVSPYAFGAAPVALGDVPPEIRCSSIDSSSWGSKAFAFPPDEGKGATMIGDRVVVFVGHGNAVNIPAGWTQLDKSDGSSWNGATFTKVMTKADIATGTVTITSSGFNAVTALLTFVGDPSSKRDIVAHRNGTGPSSDTLTTGSSPLAHDRGIYFASNRANNTVTGPGTQLRTVSGSNASGVLCTEEVSSNGSYSKTFTLGTGGASGYYDVVLTWAKTVMDLDYFLDATYGIGDAVSIPANYGNGTAPYTFSISAGALPAGLSINSSTGAITGTLTAAAGDYTFTVQMLDSAGQVVTTSVTLNASVIPTYRYMRLNVTASAASPIDLMELEVYQTVGGANVATTATATASAGSPAGLIDGSVGGGLWEPGSAPQWAKLDWGAGNAKRIAQIGMAARSGFESRCPRDFDIQVSNDNSTWTTLKSFTGQSFGSGAITKFLL